MGGRWVVRACCRGITSLLAASTASRSGATPIASAAVGFADPGALCRRESRSRSRSEDHTSELQSRCNLVCRLLLEKKTKNYNRDTILKSVYHKRLLPSRWNTV